MQQPNQESRLATLSVIESFRQMAMKSNYMGLCDAGVPELNNSLTQRSHHTPSRIPAKLRNTLTAMGLMYHESSEYVGPLGTVQGTGFGKVIYHIQNVLLFVI